jgi:hypothetical protein
MKLDVYAHSLIGHRESYLNFFLNTFSSKKISKKDLLLSKSPVLFLMIEDSFLLYFFICLYRTILGRITAGFLFRPKPVVDNPSLKLKVKRTALYILKKIPNVKTLLIIPDSTHPEFSTICDGWIYDFQFWDLQEKDYETFIALKEKKQVSSLFTSINNMHNGRKVLCALGGQDRIKGFDTFATTYIDNKNIQKQFLFAYGGKVKGFNELAISFDKTGGYSKNEFISDDDFIALYASSDLVWALYAEDYDQASGIFGRAVQLGIPVLVRTNSLIHKICILENIPHVAIIKEKTSKLISIEIPSRNLQRGKEFRNVFKEKSIVQLNETLGIELNRNIR